MIYSLKGTLTYLEPTFAVVECGGVGFKCFVSTTTITSLTSIGTEVRLLTYMSIREDAMDLYGFSTQNELDAFKLLISVSGVGPKGACSILNQLGPDGVISAILTENDKAIAKSVGIGPKTAKKVVIELKDKVHGAITELPDNEEVLSDDSVISDVVAALCNLGYSNQESLKAVKRVKGAESMDLETLFSAALKQMI